MQKGEEDKKATHIPLPTSDGLKKKPESLANMKGDNETFPTYEHLDLSKYSYENFPWKQLSDMEDKTEAHGIMVKVIDNIPNFSSTCPYSCPFGKNCLLNATKKSDLKNHLNNMHIGYTKYSCEKCQEGFTTYQYYARHSCMKVLKRRHSTQLDSSPSLSSPSSSSSSSLLHSSSSSSSPPSSPYSSSPFSHNSFDSPCSQYSTPLSPQTFFEVLRPYSAFPPPTISSSLYLTKGIPRSHSPKAKITKSFSAEKKKPVNRSSGSYIPKPTLEYLGYVPPQNDSHCQHSPPASPSTSPPASSPTSPVSLSLISPPASPLKRYPKDFDEEDLFTQGHPETFEELVLTNDLPSIVLTQSTQLPLDVLDFHGFDNFDSF